MRGALVGSVLVVFAITLLFTRVRQRAPDFFTEDEIQGVERLYDIAPPGAVVYAAPNVPVRFRGYADYAYHELGEVDAFDEVEDASSAAQFAASLRTTMLQEDEGQGVYVVLSGSGIASFDLFQTPRGRLTLAGDAIRSSPGFRAVYANRDLQIYTLAQAN